MSSGYGWKDTASHEYIHLVVWRSKDKVFVWLQEGLAKHFEQDWKDELGHQDVHKTFYLSHRQQSHWHMLKEDSFVPFEKF